MPSHHKITPCLWFDRQALEAAEFYVSLFPDSRILDVSHYGEGMPMPAGTPLVVNFQLEGRDFMALNGGPDFKFSEAVSFYVHCTTQAEVDALWVKLTDGGEESVCGWLKDKYGLSWQIIPDVLGELMSDPDPAKAQRVTQAMLQMRKIDIAALERAHQGR
jgi:predicted 3-demethylubiquinone-9 3-methyltransferase (glyoxalase superfamily)